MNKTRIITIGGTFLCALGIGYFMQNAVSDQPAPGVSAEPVARADFKPLSEAAFTPAPRSQLDETSSATPEASAIVTQVAPKPESAPAASMQVAAASDANSETGEVVSDQPPLDMAALETGATADPAQPSEPADQPELACDIDATATAEAAAMVRLELSAPCFANERAVVHHNGMMFTAVTDGSGMLTELVPALAETAVFIVEFANGDGAVATAQVSSLPFYDRVVLQWTGDAGFQLHAREYGANYGDDGHVWSGAARDVTAAALGEGGFVTRLGAADSFEPRMAEIYTFPSGTAKKPGDIALSVEAEVTDANCGRDIEAQSMELKADGALRTQYLTLAVPDCGSVGDFLVLNNLMDDLKIAAN